MQEPKYQLEQETIPIPFLFGTYNGTGKVLCALTIYNLPTENRWMTQTCCYKYVICSQEISKL